MQDRLFARANLSMAHNRYIFFAIHFGTCISANILPIGVPHETTEEIQLGDFTIPAGTALIANLTAILNDPNYFPEPEAFKPERHLDESGNFFKNEAAIPFSIGM